MKRSPKIFLTLTIILFSTTIKAQNSTNGTTPTNGTTTPTVTAGNGCLVDMCLICPNTTSLTCTKCRAGWYLRSVTGGATPYNVCWSIWKLLVWIFLSLLLALLLCYCCLAAYRYGEGKSLVPWRWDNRQYDRTEYYETDPQQVKYIRDTPRESVRVIREPPMESVRVIREPPRESIRYMRDPIVSEPARVVRRPSAVYSNDPTPVRRYISVS